MGLILDSFVRAAVTYAGPFPGEAEGLCHVETGEHVRLGDLLTFNAQGQVVKAKAGQALVGIVVAPHPAPGVVTMALGLQVRHRKWK